jgi:glycosyltransferase involved in cell wall biosynthesis
MARALGSSCEVRLAHPGQREMPADGFAVHRYQRGQFGSLRPLLEWSSVVIANGYLIHLLPQLSTCGRPLVADVYDVFLVENLAHNSRLPLGRWAESARADAGIVNSILQAADFFVCASDRQRDFWLGALAANGRLGPESYTLDPTLRDLIDVVPFGIPAEQPQKTRAVLRGVYQGFGQTDRVLLWAGGLWDWFDPASLLRALAVLREERPNVRLFFMAKQHPDSSVVPEMPAATRAVSLSRELGLLGSSVFFGDWIPYAERANYLLEADVGISVHHESVESRLAFRTRILDYIWAGLPIVATGGDYLGDLIEAERLGFTVRPGDIPGLTDAIRRILDEREARERRKEDFQRIRRSLSWERVIAPIERFVAKPKFAPDRDGAPRDRPEINIARPQTLPVHQHTPAHRLPLRALRIAREGGVGALMHEARRYLRWWLAYRQ